MNKIIKSLAILILFGTAVMFVQSHKTQAQAVQSDTGNSGSYTCILNDVNTNINTNNPVPQGYDSWAEWLNRHTCTQATPTPTQAPTVSPTPTPEPGNPGTPGNPGSGGGPGSSVCTDQKPTDRPANLQAVRGPLSGQVTLTWEYSKTPFTDFSIQYSDTPDTQKWGILSTGGAHSYLISGLGSGTYYFWVRAVNGCTQGDTATVVVGGPAVLGLSNTSSNNPYAELAITVAAIGISLAGLKFFKKNA